MRDGPAGRRRTIRWVDRSLRAKGLVVIAVPIGILVVVLATTFWFAHVDNRAQAIAGRARQIVDGATALENSVLEAQTGIDAYLLTGTPAFRDSYTRAAATIPVQLRDLNATTGPGAPESAVVAAIGRDVARLTFDMAQLDAQPPAPAGVVRALQRFSQLEGGHMRADVATLSSTENAIIASQRSAIHTSSTLLPAIAIAALVLAVAAGVVVSQLFTAAVVTRLRRLERATAALERGEVPEVVPTGRDEIGRLSAHMLQSATMLRERAIERDRARRELEDILTASPVVSLCYDVATWRFSYASPNIERLLGITAERAMSDPGAVMVRFHPDTTHQLRDAIVAGAGRQGERFDVLARFRRDPRSEDWREADAVYSVECGPEGEPHSVISYLVDVSERHVAERAAEERRFLLESIFHASPDTIVVRDTAGRVLLASSPLAPGVGAGSPHTSPQEVLDQAYERGDIGDDGGAALDRMFARCLAGEDSPEPVVTTGHLPDGDPRTYETRARPVLGQSGRVTGTVTVTRDVTDRVRLEQSLRGASNAALRASEAKSEFLSRMSHELRTPLNAILGFAQLLELDELPPDQASSVDQIKVAGRHLLALINEVLDISRIEAGRLTLSTEPVDVRDVLDEVATLLVPVAESAAIAMSVDRSGARALYVQADRQRLLQVLLNLGSNALKYNHRGGSVSFQTRPGDDGRIRFEVHDTGPGIAPEQQGRLFVPFSRLGAERSTVEGTGVGLALSKQLVEVMGGSIGVESTPGRGSTFWVELERAEPPRLEAAPAGAEEPTGRNRRVRESTAPASMEAEATATERAGAARRNGADGHDQEGEADTVGAKPVVVLHIEDNPSNASLVEQVLSKRAAVRLVSAAEGRSGLELARQHRPDLVLLDLHLPDLSGDELLHRLKAVPELADTKVVVVSADATPSRIRSMLDLGVEGYLTKPVDVEALLRLVDHEIGARQRERR